VRASAHRRILIVACARNRVKSDARLPAFLTAGPARLCRLERHAAVRPPLVGRGGRRLGGARLVFCRRRVRGETPRLQRITSRDAQLDEAVGRLLLRPPRGSTGFLARSRHVPIVARRGREGRAEAGSLPPSGSDPRQRDPSLFQVLAAFVRIRPLAHVVALKEDDLRDALIGVNLGG